MTDKVLYQQDGPIVTITLNDPADAQSDLGAGDG